MRLCQQRTRVRAVAVFGKQRSVAVDSVYVVGHYVLPDAVVTGIHSFAFLVTRRGAKLVVLRASRPGPESCPSPWGWLECAKAIPPRASRGATREVR